MRLLLIVQDARFRSLIRHHVTCEWANADLVMRSTRAPGRLPPEFLAQGYDAVLIDQDWLGGQGLDWLRDLAARRGFAPILFLAQQVNDQTAREARIFGAFGVLTKQRFAHETLIAVLTEAARVQRSAQADWRVSPFTSSLIAPLSGAVSALAGTRAEMGAEWSKPLATSHGFAAFLAQAWRSRRVKSMPTA